MANMYANENYQRKTHPTAASLLEAMSPEEKVVWAKCNHDAIYSAGLPLAIFCGATVHFGTRSGIFKSSPRFGSIPGVLGAACVGYMLGRFSYSTVCLEKVMAVPDSNVRKILMENIAVPPPINRYPTLEAPAEAVRSAPNSSLDLDTYQPPSTLDGFISSSNPSDITIDNDEDLSDGSNVQTRPSTTYAELRDRNRQDFMRNRDRRISSSLPPVSRHPPSSDVDMNMPPVRRNKYGDVWD